MDPIQVIGTLNPEISTDLRGTPPTQETFSGHRVAGEQIVDARRDLLGVVKISGRTARYPCHSYRTHHIYSMASWDPNLGDTPIHPAWPSWHRSSSASDGDRRVPRLCTAKPHSGQAQVGERRDVGLQVVVHPHGPEHRTAQKQRRRRLNLGDLDDSPLALHVEPGDHCTSGWIEALAPELEDLILGDEFVGYSALVG